MWPELERAHGLILWSQQYVRCSQPPTPDTILVFAPTGCAAFNAGGETIHRGFGLPRDIQNLIISIRKIFSLNRLMSYVMLACIRKSSLALTVGFARRRSISFYSCVDRPSSSRKNIKTQSSLALTIHSQSMLTSSLKLA